MARKWSAVTLLRELRDFKETQGLTDTTTLAEISAALESQVVEEAIARSERKPTTDRQEKKTTDKK